MDYLAPPSLAGRAAIVTGASRGIGLGIAEAFAQAGASLCLTARKADELNTAQRQLLDAVPDATVTTFAGSIGDPAAVTASVAHTMEHLGRVDIVVNNAATNPAFGPLMDVTSAAWRKTFAVNVEGPLQLIQEAWRAWMSEHGGTVLNLTTSGMYTVAPFLGAYEATKTTLRYLTKQLAGELAPKVRVNSISPGTVKTQMSRVLWENGEEQVASFTPMGRIGLPSHCAQLALFLCSDHGSWITGTDVVIDGGALVGSAGLRQASSDGGGPQLMQNLHDAGRALS
jgi:NAD(P)-dependent dehydrogenase (short-subunit alcohol dehydrogenase family)